MCSSQEDCSKYTIGYIGHAQLKEISVGLHHQCVRLGGLTEKDYYCCVTRDPSLVHIFVTRITFIVDTDFIKTKPQTQLSDSDEEDSIYASNSTSGTQSEHPSGVSFLYNDEQATIDLKAFIASTDTDSIEPDPTLLSVNYIHINNLQPITMVLTQSSLHLLHESYVSFPIPECALEPPSCNQYTLERTLRLADVSAVVASKDKLQFVLTLGSESLTLLFSSVSLAESFHTQFLSVHTTK